MNKKSKLEKLTPLVLGTCLLTLVACGNDDDDSGGGTGTTQPEQQQEGQYRVVLTPVNPGIAGSPTGTGEFNIQGDEFRALMNIDSAPNAQHAQHIHIGKRCAGMEDDTNGDQIIDAVEASAAAGGALIPLDSDLRTQSAGSFNTSGVSYDYNESTSLLAMLAELRLPDLDTSDDLVKLGVDEELNLEGRVVEVHGVPASTVLPATVQGLDDDSPQESLPILCGVIQRVDTGTTTGSTTTGTTGTTSGTDTTTGGTSTGGTGTTTGTDTTTGGTSTGGTGTTTGTDTTTGGTSTGGTGTTGTTAGTTGG